MQFLLLPLSLALMACSGAADGSAPGASSGQATSTNASELHPLSGLQIIDVTVTSGDARHVFRTELADSQDAQRRGMMFRESMEADEAMLFPSVLPDIRSFWMKNTPISLDIIFVGLDGRILNIAANAQPYSLESVYSEGIASAVLEIRGGRAAELGIAPGDKVEYALQ